MFYFIIKIIFIVSDGLLFDTEFFQKIFELFFETKKYVCFLIQ